MIQYSLKCDQGHGFDSWFQSAAAFETLKSAGHLSCVICGTNEVDKAIMAPRVSVPARSDNAPTLTSDEDTAKTALAEIKRHVEENADYVGSNFAQEARSMHQGVTPERAIYGEANGAQTKQLIEEGVPVMPLPFCPTRKAN